MLGLLGIFSAGALEAASLPEIQNRMKARLSAIDELKEDGKAGENNVGLLEARGEVSSRERNLIEEENADRRALYEMVARQQGQSVREIGKQRAIRIAEISRGGVWLQKPDGTWYKK